jgi:hypothetical protein
MYAETWLNALQCTTKVTTHAELPITAIMIFTHIVDYQTTYQYVTFIEFSHHESWSHTQ